MSGRDLRSSFPRKTRIDELGNQAFINEVDGFTFIDAEQSRVLAGKQYEYIQYIPVVNTSKGCRIAFFVTGTEPTQHVLTEGNWSAASRLEIWENVSLANTGVKPTIYNSNRNSDETSNLIVFSGIVPTSGHLIRTRYDGSFYSPGTIRGQALCPKPNTYYAVWLKPAASGVLASIGLRWYEKEV